MKSKAIDKKVSPSSPTLTQVIRKSFIIYLISVVTLPVICFIFGFQTLDNIGTGLMYGSLCFVLFGVLTFAGNTVPAQLSKLSLPKYNAPSVNRHQEAKSGKSPTRDEVIRFFLITLICAAFLLITGFFLKITW